MTPFISGLCLYFIHQGVLFSLGNKNVRYIIQYIGIERHKCVLFEISVE